MEINYWIYIFITIGTLIYLYQKRKFSYWKNRKTAYLEPMFPFGNIKLVLQRKAAVTEVIQNIYDKVKARGERYGGIYAYLSPNFIPVDLDLVKCILQKDFSHFTNHGRYVNEESDPLSAHLANLTNEKWRNMRVKLTPTFTSETLRKHPPVGVIPRVCNKQYNVPNSDLIIENGTKVHIPVFSIHRDPDHYPNPDTFDPERFNEANIAKRHPFAYMPFGEGPRTCIGLRFGKLQTKVGLCTVLRNYRVILNEKTKLPIKYETGVISAVKGGVWLDLEPITTKI